MHDIVSIQQAVARARENGIPLSEYALRLWIRQGRVPIRKVGTKALVSYSRLVSYISCEDGMGDNPPPAQLAGAREFGSTNLDIAALNAPSTVGASHGIRRVDG